MNKVDFEWMVGILEVMGYWEVLVELDVDLVFYNICIIWDNVEQKVYSYFGRQVQRKCSNFNFILVVVGCVVQQEGELLF